MTPLSEIGTISVLFQIQMGFLVIYLICTFCHRKIGSMLAERFADNMQSFSLWGSIINLILVSYLPVCISMFISVVGLQWEDINSAVRLNNIWTIFMLNAWLLCPAVLFCVIFKNRHNIGKLENVAEQQMDYSKMADEADESKKRKLGFLPRETRWRLSGCATGLKLRNLKK